jgi:hypothetical protein
VKDPLTPRQAFQQLYRCARVIRRRKPDTSAYMLADFATDKLVHNGFDYYDLECAFKPVLWAMHWRFKEQTRRVPQGMSERHFGFVMHTLDSGLPNEVFFSRKLPGGKYVRIEACPAG